MHVVNKAAMIKRKCKQLQRSGKTAGRPNKDCSEELISLFMKLETKTLKPVASINSYAFAI